MRCRHSKRLCSARQPRARLGGVYCGTRTTSPTHKPAAPKRAGPTHHPHKRLGRVRLYPAQPCLPCLQFGRYRTTLQPLNGVFRTDDRTGASTHHPEGCWGTSPAAHIRCRSRFGSDLLLCSAHAVARPRTLGQADAALPIITLRFTIGKPHAYACIPHATGAWGVDCVLVMGDYGQVGSMPCPPSCRTHPNTGAQRVISLL